MVVFGMTLFFEVACLPWISACAIHMEKTVISDGTELGEKESEKDFHLDKVLLPLTWLALAVQLNFDTPQDDASSVPSPTTYAAKAPVFIVQRAIRI